MKQMDESESRLLEQRLTERLFDLYDRVGQGTGYWANYFLRDLKRLGGLEVARKLLNARAVSEGFERLKKEHLLRESVEAVVLEPQFQPLFSPNELARARQRLAEHGYTPDDLMPEIAAPSAELASLLERVEAAPDQMSRWELRKEVVSYGPAAREAMRAPKAIATTKPTTIKTPGPALKPSPLKIAAKNGAAPLGGSNMLRSYRPGF